jgi:hypothetical protein
MGIASLDEGGREVYLGPRNMTVRAGKRSDSRPNRYYRLSKWYYRSRTKLCRNMQKKATQTGTTGFGTGRVQI